MKSFKNLIEKSSKNCVSVYEHAQFDQLIADKTEFYSVSQFLKQPNTIAEGDALGSGFRKISKPNPGIGAFLYIKDQESDNLLLLKAILDSSD